jgi:hypothetical protein
VKPLITRSSNPAVSTVHQLGASVSAMGPCSQTRSRPSPFATSVNSPSTNTFGSQPAASALKPAANMSLFVPMRRSLPRQRMPESPDTA